MQIDEFIFLSTCATKHWQGNDLHLNDDWVLNVPGARRSSVQFDLCQNLIQ